MRLRLHGEGVDRPDTAASFHQMGRVALWRGSLNEAEQWNRKGMDMNQRLHGQQADHPDIAASLHQMGVITQAMKSLDEAEKWYRSSHEMM